MTTCTPAERASAAQALMQMLSGYWLTQGVYTVAKLGVPDLLKNGPQSVSSLASQLGANEDFLYRVMRALSGFGVFEEQEGRTFRIAPVGELLQADHPTSMRAVALMLGEEHYQAWGALKDSVLSGKSPFESVYGMQVFEYFQQNPEASETFNGAMTALVRNDHAVVASNYDFSRFKCIVDVGGGHGMLLAAILNKAPNLEGVLFDLPHVVKNAADPLKQAGVLDRCRIEGGSFFESITEGGDAYIMAHIIHDWSDERSTEILRNIHNVMPDHGTLLLVESVVEAGNHPSIVKLMDLNMLVMTPGGRERTESEFAMLLDGAGFRLTQVIRTETDICLVEAVKK